MSKIHLRREHDLTPKAARRKVERVAEVLATKFDAACTWKGDVLLVEHPSVNGKVTVDYTEPEPVERKKGREGRVVSSGAFALQSHDAKSKVWIRNIRVKVLP